MSSNDIKNNTKLNSFEGIENLNILEGLKNLDYLKGVTEVKNINEEVEEVIEVIENIAPEVKIIEKSEENSEENDIEYIKDEEAIMQPNQQKIFDSFKNLGITGIFESFKRKKEDNEDNEDIDTKSLYHLKPRIFRSKLHELNNQEIPTTIQKLFKYTQKSHKLNKFSKFFRALRIGRLKFKYKNIEFFEWQNTEEAETLLLNFIKDTTNNWSLKHQEFEKTVYNKITLQHKRRLLYIDPYGFIESGTTLYKIKLKSFDGENRFLIKLLD